MEERLNEIIEANELALINYQQEVDELRERIQFMREHKFEQEAQYLITQKDAKMDLFLDYRKAIEDLRKMLNDWQS